jgi:magnesium-transporting ATPase (P-type)
MHIFFSCNLVVVQSGMDTSKGKLLSTILFPEQMIFKYDEELPIVVLMLLCYAAVCFALSLVFQVRLQPSFPSKSFNSLSLDL